jgi:hypothetical protein
MGESPEITRLESVTRGNTAKVSAYSSVEQTVCNQQ